MPHNILLHSSLIQTRSYPRTTAGKRLAIRVGPPLGRSLGRARLVRLCTQGASRAMLQGPVHAALVQRGRTRVSSFHTERPGACVRRVIMGLASGASGASHTVVGPGTYAWVARSAWKCLVPDSASSCSHRSVLAVAVAPSPAS